MSMTHTHTETYTDRQTDRQTETDRQTDRQTETEIETETERDRERQRQRDRDIQREREREREILNYFFYINSLSMSFFASFFLHLTKTFCRKQLCFFVPCVSSYRRVHSGYFVL